MKTCTLPRLLPLLALWLGLSSTTAARADNADIDVPGPTGRTWIGLSGDYGAGYGEVEDASTSANLYKTRSTRRSAALDVSLALHERVSINLWGGRSLYRSEDKSPSNYIYTYTSATNSGGIGIDLRPIGTPTSDGFGLVTTAWLNHAEGGDNFYSLAVQPQYRFNGSWLGAVSVGLSRSGGDYRSYTVDARAVWKATPDVSLSPGVSYYRSKTSDYPALRSLGADLTFTYHVNHNLSFLAGVSVSHDADRQLAGLRLTNNYDGSVTAGVRWAF